MPKRKRGSEKPPAGPPAASFPLAGSDVLDVIGSKGVPKREMHDIIHAPDDGIAEQPVGPQQEPSVSFHADPEVGDAGADLAEEFGRNYLQSATPGQDMSELENPSETDPTEVGGPSIIEPPTPMPAPRPRRHRPHA